jgi:hypothetical protein
MNQWGEKRDHQYSLTDFSTLKKKNGESLLEFYKMFNQLYNIFRPSPTTKVTYAASHDPDFSMMLRERRSINLGKCKIMLLILKVIWLS